MKVQNDTVGPQTNALLCGWGEADALGVGMLIFSFLLHRTPLTGTLYYLHRRVDILVFVLL